MGLGLIIVRWMSFARPRNGGEGGNPTRPAAPRVKGATIVAAAAPQTLDARL
jgi:hypothetical protein